jgi:hypothetical protein
VFDIGVDIAEPSYLTTSDSESGFKHLSRDVKTPSVLTSADPVLEMWGGVIENTIQVIGAVFVRVFC